MTQVLTLGEAAAWARLSTRTLRRAMRDPVRPLRCYRPGRRVLIDLDDLRRWLASHRAAAPSGAVSGVSPVVSELLAGLRSAPQAAPRRRSAQNIAANQALGSADLLCPTQEDAENQAEAPNA